LRVGLRGDQITGAALAVLALCIGLPTAQAQTSDPAQRQLEYCWSELAEGEFERARKSADSALMLNPTLYAAMLCKADAYAGEGNTVRARSVMGAYLELRIGLKPSTVALDLMDRIGLNPDGTVAEVEAPAEESSAKGGSPGPLPGVIIAASGGALAGVGSALHGVAWQSAQPGAGGVYTGTTDEFGGLLTQNRAGFALLVGGGAAAAAGVVAAIVGGASKSTPQAAVLVAPTPNGGIALTLGGTW
jgi:hypothetical protein